MFKFVRGCVSQHDPKKKKTGNAKGVVKKLRAFDHELGMTQLMIAARNGDLDGVSSLLATSTKSEICALTTISGLTAYDFAIRSNHDQVAALIGEALEFSNSDKEAAQTKVNIIEVIQLLKGARRMGGAAMCRKTWAKVIKARGGTTEDGVHPTGKISRSTSASQTKAGQSFEHFECVQFSLFESFGEIPRSDNPNLVRQDLSNIDKSIAIFISHRWERANLDPTFAHPDLPDNSKFKKIVTAIRSWAENSQVNLDNVYIWIDFACIEQSIQQTTENLATMRRQVNSLPAFITCSDIVMSIDDDQYWNRGWCRLEQAFGYEFKVPRKMLNDTGIHSVHRRPNNPRSGALTSEKDRPLLKLLGALSGYSDDSGEPFGLAPSAAFEAQVQNVLYEAVHMVYTIPEDLTLGDRITFGEGSFSTTYEASNCLTNERFIVKVYEEKEVATINVMVGVLWNLVHPNLLRVYDFFFAGGKGYLVMEKAAVEKDLFDTVLETGNDGLDEPTTQHIMRDLLSVIGFLHKHNVVHRNIKPDAIMLLSKGKMCLTALELVGVGTRFVEVSGTPNYVAPEVLMKVGYGAEVDLWSAGVVLFIMLCGYPPFYAEDQTDQFEIIKSGKFQFNHKYWAGKSELAKDLIRKLLVVDPKQRLSASQALEHPWLSGS